MQPGTVHRDPQASRIQRSAEAVVEAQREWVARRRRQRRARALISAIDRVLAEVEDALAAGSMVPAAHREAWIAWIERRGAAVSPDHLHAPMSLADFHEALLDWQGHALPAPSSPLPRRWVA